MSHNKEIGDYFRSRQEEFNEVPSRAAWKKLERRLETHQKRNRLSFVRSLGMVAAVLLLVVFTFLFSTMDFNTNGQYYDSVASVEPISTQELDPEAYKVVEYTLKYRDRMLNPIEEGSDGNKLMVRGQ